MNLFVFFCPSKLEPLWRKAIIDTSIERGWAPLAAEDADLEAQIERARPAPVLVLSSSPNLAPPDAPDFACAVIADRPTFWTQVLADGADDVVAAEAAHWASFYFAKASELVQAGAMVIDANHDEISLAGLGSIVRAPSPAAALITSADPLDIYRTIPPQIGAASHWPVSLFTMSGSTKDQGFGGRDESIDLTGRARALVRGPDIALPPGVWRMSATIMVDPEGSRSHLRFFWGAGGDAESAEAVVSGPGVYTIALDRRWTTVEAAELTIQAAQPHFQGRLELMDCAVTLVDSV